MSPEKAFKGRTALITGSGHADGIGSAIAVAFAKRGANVVLTDREQFPDTEKVIRSVRKAGAQCVFYPADLEHPAAPAELVQAAVAEFRSLTDVVCNAATNVKGSVLRLEIEEIARIIAVNFRSVVLLGTAAFEQFTRQSDRMPGIVTNVSSLNVIWPKLQPVYNATKAGVEGWTTQLANDMGHWNRRCDRVTHPLRSNCIRVGPTLTGETVRYGADSYNREQSQLLAIPRAALPEEIAENVAALHGADFANVSGAILPVGGVIPWRPMSQREKRKGRKMR